VDDPRDAEIAALRRELANRNGNEAVDAPEREDRAPVLSVDEMAGDMKPAALARAAQPPSSAQQKSMRQMEWAGELVTSGPPRMRGDEVELAGRVTALEAGLVGLSRQVEDLPGAIVDLLRKQAQAAG
jgi:hypothetical protein